MLHAEAECAFLRVAREIAIPRHLNQAKSASPMKNRYCTPVIGDLPSRLTKKLHPRDLLGKIEGGWKWVLLCFVLYRGESS